MKIGVIIPDKGDRPEFLKHCLSMLEKQTLKVDSIYLVNQDLGIQGCDISARYKLGLKKVFEKDDCDVCFLIENDDWYAPNYIESMVEAWDYHLQPDLFGLETTIYYHIGLNKYKKMFHKGRASAFSTMCTKEILKYDLPKDSEPFFDIGIWKLPIRKYSFVSNKNLCLGIKHGEGVCGGKAHNNNFPYTESDLDMSYLKSIVDEDSFNFYAKRTL